MKTERALIKLRPYVRGVEPESTLLHVTAPQAFPAGLEEEKTTSVRLKEERENFPTALKGKLDLGIRSLRMDVRTDAQVHSQVNNRLIIESPPFESEW